MSVTILPLKQDEVEAYCEALKRLSGDGPGFPADALDYYMGIWTKDKVNQAIMDERYVILAAWDSGKIEGLLLGVPPEGGVGTIIWVLVDKKSRRRGIGRGLLSEAFIRYKTMGCHKVKLTAPTREAVEFYLKQGMNVEGFHKDHWWHMDIWSMGNAL